MQNGSDVIRQFQEKAVRSITQITFVGSICFLLYKIYFYWTKFWFDHPTLQGMLILLLIIAITIGSFGLLSNLRNLQQWLLCKPVYHIWLLRASGLSWILLICSSLFVFVKPEFSSWKDKVDIALYLTWVCFVSWLLLYIYQSKANTERIVTIQKFIQHKRIFLLYAILCILKTVLITPYALTLIAASDGFHYWSMARQLFSGSLDIVNNHHYPPLYPLSISLAFITGERHSLMAISIINIFLSSAVLFPVYLIAKSLLSKNTAFLISVITAINPFQWVYPAFPASENLYYMLFFWILFFVYEQPKNKKYSTLWNVITGLLIGLSWITRYQTLPLIPIYLLAWWLKPIGEGDGIELKPSPAKIRQFLIISASILVCFGIWVMAGIQNGVPLKEITGFHIEGGNKSKVHPITNLFFWIGISSAFIALMVGPALHMFGAALMSTKKLRIDKKIFRWVVLATLTSGVLLFTIARHAWLASYNYIEPIRLIGRYAIYVEMVLILTGLVFYHRIQGLSQIRYFTGLLISIVVVFISYQVFSNPNWIFPRESIFFLHLDGYTPLFLDWKFFTVISIGGAVLGFTLNKWGMEKQILVILATIGVVQLISLPYYRESVTTLENQGRYISEIVDQIINSENLNPNPNDSVTIHYPETVKYLDRQFRVKGVDITNYSFEVLQEYPVKKQKCEPFIQIDLANGKKYGIMSRTRGCEPTANQPVISEFEFNQRNYFLAPITR